MAAGTLGKIAENTEEFNSFVTCSMKFPWEGGERPD
jgi:hypothetical protein